MPSALLGHGNWPAVSWRHPTRTGTDTFTPEDWSEVDWISFFDEVRGHPDARPGEPEAVPGGVIGISDVTLHDGSIEFPLDWGNGDDEARWVQWIHRIAVGRSVRSKNNHRKLQLHRPVFQRTGTARKFDA